jgi:hypothetical protein
LELETEEQESRQLIAQEEMKLKKWQQGRNEMARSRDAQAGAQSNDGRSGKTEGRK